MAEKRTLQLKTEDCIGENRPCHVGECSIVEFSSDATEPRSGRIRKEERVRVKQTPRLVERGGEVEGEKGEGKKGEGGRENRINAYRFEAYTYD